jgi:O-antigen ligase
MAVPAFVVLDAVSHRGITDAIQEQVRTKYLHEDYRGEARTLAEAIDNASGGRFKIWQEGLEMFFARPWLGSGYRPYAEVQAGEEVHIHSFYLDLLVSFGLVGSLPIFAFILLWLRSMFRRAVLSGSEYDFAPCVAYCLAILAVNFVASTRAFFTLSSFVVLLMTATAGVAAQLTSAEAQRRVQYGWRPIDSRLARRMHPR